MTNTMNVLAQAKEGEKTGWFTVLPYEALTAADRTSGVFYHPTARGIILQVVTANKAGTLSITPKLQYVDPAGTYQTLWTAAAAISTNATSIYVLSEDTATGTTATEKALIPLPREFAIMLDYSGTPASDKADTTVYACFLL